MAIAVIPVKPQFIGMGFQEQRILLNLILMGLQPLKKQRKKKYKPTNSKQAIYLICAFVAEQRHASSLLQCCKARAKAWKSRLGTSSSHLYCGRRGRGSTRDLLGECFKFCSGPYYVKKLFKSPELSKLKAAQAVQCQQQLCSAARALLLGLLVMALVTPVWVNEAGVG